VGHYQRVGGYPCGEGVAVTIALSLIAKFGRPAVYTQVTEGSFDPSSSSFSTGSTATASVSVVAFPYESREIDGTTILAHDVKCFVAPDAMSAINPRIGDTIAFTGAETVRVVQVGRIYKGTSSELYVLQTRSDANG